MPLYSRKSVTFIELLIAIVLLSVIVLAVNNVNIFSRYHLVSTDRRVKVQNDASRCLEHITKYVSGAIGNAAVSVVIIDSSSLSNTLSAFTDYNGNGSMDISSALSPRDRWVRYSMSGNAFNYYADCGDAAAPACGSVTEVIANDITAFNAVKNISNGNNYADISITACWDPAATTAACGTPDNPSVTMNTSINLPSVSTN